MEAVERLAGILERRNVEWEIYWEEGKGVSFRIERERIERAQWKFYSGIGLRVGLNGKVGFSYLTGLEHDEESLLGLVKRAEKLARIGSRPFKGFPARGKFPRVEGLYDGAIDALDFDGARALAGEFVEKMRELKGNKEEYTLAGAVSFGTSRAGIANSNGVEGEEPRTGLAMWAYAVKKNGRSGSGYASQSYTTLEGVKEGEELIRKAMREADSSQRAEKIGGFTGEVLLEPQVVEALVYLFLENLYGDSVYYSRSRFSIGDLGKKVLSENISIIDDSTLEFSPGSYSFDGEGVPGRRKELISRGELRSFILDHTYGRLLGLESTGNAVRDFRSVPRIGTGNVLVEEGGENLGDWSGVVVSKVFGEHTANPVTGDFSLTVELGYVVKNGEVRPFSGNMISGNVFEALGKVSRVGKEAERRGSFYSPRVVTELRLV
ncbi:TldD/PmbA family protein [Thermococcus sp. AM4]|uniref:TldD/PmbA family protein n=1 Tax=Thermococcus sp. (strain AM4) TaxID=246969 RepID=UPI000187127A|nr:TldD/PmbA family protein [Thermococcus sp. AM4]EEB74101.1 zinc-dependent protease, TldD/PmbA family [Thermococcus sp. AM4]